MTVRATIIESKPVDRELVWGAGAVELISLGSIPMRCYWATLIRPLRIYSCLSATIGSTLAARLAGKKHETTATPASNADTATNVSGSPELTP